MHNGRMTALLVSAATRTTITVLAGTIRRPLAARAAAQHAGRSAVLARVTTAVDTVPSASAFQSAL